MTGRLARWVQREAHPRCGHCDGPTEPLSEANARDFPPTFELRYRCPACGVVISRYRVYDFND